MVIAEATAAANAEVTLVEIWKATLVEILKAIAQASGMAHWWCHLVAKCASAD